MARTKPTPITAVEAQRAIYIDFEGREKEPPAYFGALCGGGDDQNRWTGSSKVLGVPSKCATESPNVLWWARTSRWRSPSMTHPNDQHSRTDTQ